MEITVYVSKPYTLIAGGWSGLRPVGQRRDYTAELDGVMYRQTNKATMLTNLRHAAYRGGYRGKITFRFVEK